jgi:hypothetical protein
MQAVLAGKPLPAGNRAVAAARSFRSAPPAQMATRSISWRRQTDGYVRATSMGLVAIEELPDLSVVMGVYPQ